jgi:hypothetical protein
MRVQMNELDRLFPMPDVPSARLARIKARALYGAGIITAEQRACILARANDLIRGTRRPPEGRLEPAPPESAQTQIDCAA